MWHAALVLAALAATPPADGGFRWLDPRADAPLLAQVGKAFRRELRPDDEATASTRNEIPARELFLHRVGVLGTHALVLVASSESRDEREGAWFSAFNHDLETGRSVPIPTSDALFAWRFRGLASFEPSGPPDVVFQYLNCLECEATLSLGSFRFDPSSGRWAARCWRQENDDVDFVEIMKATQYGDEDIRYDFRHAIGDVTGDGLAEVVVWRSETGLSTGQVRRKTLVHAIVDGQPVARPPSEVEKPAVEALIFPRGAPKRAQPPRKGRYSNARYAFTVATPARAVALPLYWDGTWEDGIFLPLPVGSSLAPDEVRRRGIGIEGRENFWFPEDPETSPARKASPGAHETLLTDERTRLGGLPARRVVSRSSEDGTERIEETVRAFRRIEPDLPGETRETSWVHFVRYELRLSTRVSKYEDDRKVFEKVLASFRPTPIP